ncbi:heparin lyase I family protein [Nubsella zeaxanthinifaciens]|uniref:heparin lyase I family protein n=1 Tax=Nubsella zeaxanthinifaciens TaxID=392412 RepID=UPI000DE49214|nr:heparin lyase I family protein [Nubsella zeaxanthinifaciens]
MKKSSYRIAIYACCCVLLSTACSKRKEKSISEPTSQPVVTPKVVNTDTILNVTYENGELSSGIAGVRGTVAIAPDAAYLISPGRTGNKAIAHKVVLGIAGYYSAEAYRSEADALEYEPALFFPGMERRYEFSVYLKDWEQWNADNPPYGDNIFQLKVSGGDPVPVRILTRRNTIVVRYDASGNAVLINDFRPQINKWIDFRIDVKWTLDNTGYFKIYSKYEGEQDFTLRFQNLDARTFTGNQLANGQKGYIKWGVYREAGTDANDNLITTDNVLTRIAYHDNIRIIKLPLN